MSTNPWRDSSSAGVIARTRSLSSDVVDPKVKHHSRLSFTLAELEAGDVEEHGWPILDVFSYTAVDRPWIELHWLFEVVQYRLMASVGPASVVLLKAVLV